MKHKHVVGMLHLPALPGSPKASVGMEAIAERVVAEAQVLKKAGFDAVVIENFGDVPFAKDRVHPITVSCMTRLVASLQDEKLGLDVGVNVLRNDSRAALAIAAATGSSFIRVNVHVGATATDQGIIEGRAEQTTRQRKHLGVNVGIWADVHVKHGKSLSHASIGDEAADAVERGLADALIVSGAGTGRSVSLTDLEEVHEKQLGVPLYVGSGVREETLGDVLKLADGVIVGTSIKRDRVTTAPIDPDPATRFIEAVRSLE